MILLLLISNNLLSLELKGKIIHISDGDTVHLLTDNKEKIKIRLNDIDGVTTVNGNYSTAGVI